MDTITAKDLIAWGYKPGAWFPKAVAAANLALAEGQDARAAIDALAPPPVLGLRAPGALAHRINITPEGPDEIENAAMVMQHMTELMRVPTIVDGAVMPDACPTGRAPGTVPVGGIAVAKEAIHPGMHSSDICCSMSVSVFEDCDPKSILDAGMRLSHFGGGGRAPEARLSPDTGLLARFEANPLLKPVLHAATEHFATQGDGNHFFYVGRVKSSGKVALVTHHGSRKPGAMLFKTGMGIAEKHRQRLSPETGAHNAWIPSETREGEQYWSALQTIRAWTKANHAAIHGLIARDLGLKILDRFWNEHNFVFRKSDGLFYHAKGATPAWEGFADDSDGRTLIPLNMAAPILIARGRDAPNALGFAPHGAGRNFSRTTYLKRHARGSAADMIAEQAPGIDVRFFCGNPDVSELPFAYKNAASMRAEIDKFGLADIVDEIEPYGSIMAGDWLKDAPWRNKSKATQAQPE